jgi:hypothetical protein
MTKRRAPFTFENALTRVASEIGWTEAARIVGQAERTIRRWSEPDTTAQISLEASLKLDVAFHAAGGEGFPFFRCYAMRLDAESLAAVPGREQLLAGAARSAKESGEAVAAILGAAHPNALPADFAIAEREIEETMAALTVSLAALRARRDGLDNDDGEAERPRALGVAPTMQTA